MMTKQVFFLSIMLLGSLSTSAQTLRDIPLPPSQNPSGSDLPIAGGVWAGNTLYVSGWLDPERKTHPDTTLQTVAILKDLQRFLASQRMTMGNVAMMRIYLGPDPARDNKIDFAGMTAVYNQFFGTKEQPHKPARTTLQASLPAVSSGGLVEIDLIAVRSH